MGPLGKNFFLRAGTSGTPPTRDPNFFSLGRHQDSVFGYLTPFQVRPPEVVIGPKCRPQMRNFLKVSDRTHHFCLSYSRKTVLGFGTGVPKVHRSLVHREGVKLGPTPNPILPRPPRLLNPLMGGHQPLWLWRSRKKIIKIVCLAT